MNGLFLTFYGFLFFHSILCRLNVDDDDDVPIDQFSWDMIMWMRTLWATIDSVLRIYCTLEPNKKEKEKKKNAKNRKRNEKKNKSPYMTDTIYRMQEK